MYSVSESHIKYTLWNFLDPLLCSIFSWICSLVAVFLPDLGIAALSHFFGKCRTIISPKSPKAKKEKTYYKTYASIWHIDTFPYNASPNLIQLVMASLENTRRKLLGGSGGMPPPPQKFCKFRFSQVPFPEFWHHSGLSYNIP